MDTLTAILSRRSIRKYTEEPISEEHLDLLLKAGMAAPSACNHRPIHIFVIRNKKTLAVLSHSNIFSRMLAHTPLCLAIVADKKLEPFKDFRINDGSAVIENILLAAHDLGLGAVWLGTIQQQPWYAVIKKQLNLSTHMVPIGLIAIGHPNETKTAEIRYDEKNIHFDIQ